MVLLIDIIILDTVKLLENISSISHFTRIVLLLVLDGEQQHGRLPAAMTSLVGKVSIEIKKFISLFRMSVSLFFRGSKFPISHHTFWEVWQEFFLMTGKEFIIIELFFSKPLLILKGSRGYVIKRPTGFKLDLPRAEESGTPIVNFQLLLKQYSFTLLLKVLRRFFTLMTKEEAIGIYRSGELPTVEKLLLLDREVEELKNALSTKNLTSDLSTPSGMKPPYEKPSIKRRKKKLGREKGHKGVRRPKPEEIDETKSHVISECPCCHNQLGEPIATRERFTEDIPKVKPIVTKHIINIYYCNKCSKNVEAYVEDALSKSTMGIKLLVQTAYLHFYLGLPMQKVVDYLNSCLYFSVSCGGLSLAWQRLSEILMPWYKEIEMLTKNSSVLHIDETGWRVLGKTYWLWCFTSQKIRTVYYVISPSRASPVLKEVLGELFKGILVCDFFGAYNKIGAFLKQRCLLHLLRDMKRTSVSHKTDEWNAFEKRLKRIVKDSIRLSTRSSDIAPLLHTRMCELINKRLSTIIAQPYSDNHCKRLVKRLKRHEKELFVFLKHADVSYNNNFAECMIRPAVIARKNSYCNRSNKGAKTQAIMMTIFRTLRAREQDAINTLENGLRTYCKTGSLPVVSNEQENKLLKAA